MMTSLDYGISNVELKAINKNSLELVADIRQDLITRKDIAQIARLLEVNQINFEQYKAETWFKKAWILISGKRGKLTDITLNNLGKIQVGVIKIIGEILNDTSGIKDEILSIFSKLDKIQTDSLELKYLILQFNKKYMSKFKQLQKEINKTQLLLRITQVLVGICFIIGSLIQFVPGFPKQSWIIGLSCWGMAGALLLIGSIFSFKRRQRIKNPIPINTKQIENLPEKSQNADFVRTTQLLGIDKPQATSAEEPPDNRIFKIKKCQRKLLDYFQLSSEEQRLLFSLEYYLTQQDISITNGKKAEKKRWLRKWEKSINSKISPKIVTNEKKLEVGLAEIKKEKLSVPKLGSILLEASIFNPYYPLRRTKKAKSLEFNNENKEEIVEQLCDKVGFDSDLIFSALENYEEALKNIPPSTFWKKVFISVAIAIAIAITGGLAAPVIGAAIGGAMGLSGAAAISAGLAFLGGGAIAAGGFGMAGGTVVLISGGAILGAGIGGGLVSLFSNSKKLVLNELAKLEAVSKTFLAKLPKKKEAIKTVISKERNTRDAFRDECARLEKLKKPDRDKIAELETSMKYCDNAIKRLEKFLTEEIL
jgi:hypothetical protein